MERERVQSEHDADLALGLGFARANVSRGQKRQGDVGADDFSRR